MTGPPVITKYRRVLPYELMSGLGYEPLYAVAPAPATLSPVCTVSTRHYKKYHKDDLAFGTIISAPYYSQKRDDTISTYDYNTGVTAFDAVYSKHRKMVIIECWAEHVVC
ncbi:hypothetical protein EDB82DRAFT_519111 [Fusarium venenatum]|uniref:uncharacterized protein n=1 Tax=Fusarium venenatum TaxID=56646 RepID=UPI001DC1881E|nr:hypothetical protein EDB82DRAFT_519111 [Fusarium venenatum]